MKAQKYLAELLGTFVLALAVSISLIQGSPLPTAVVAGMTLGLFVYTIGSVSGAHLNPAVTIALASAKKISWKDAGWYVLYQLMGGILAMFVSEGLTGREIGMMDIPMELNVSKTVLVEAVGAFILAFGVSSVVWKKVDDDMSGLVIGGSLLLGIMLTGGFSFGILNPAVALGVGLNAVGVAIYFIGPVIGALGGVWAYRWLRE